MTVAHFEEIFKCNGVLFLFIKI